MSIPPNDLSKTRLARAIAAVGKNDRASEQSPPVQTAAASLLINGNVEPARTAISRPSDKSAPAIRSGATTPGEATPEAIRSDASIPASEKAHFSKSEATGDEATTPADAETETDGARSDSVSPQESTPDRIPQVVNSGESTAETTAEEAGLAPSLEASNDRGKGDGTTSNPSQASSESAPSEVERTESEGPTSGASRIDAVDSVADVGPGPEKVEAAGPADSKANVASDTHPEPVAAGPEEKGVQYSVKSPELYLNRELTWLSFDERVLHEAEDPRNPLLERVKFLAISDNNLDEFVMKRISWLRLQQANGSQSTAVDGRTPGQQITECTEVIRRLRAKQEAVYETLVSELAEKGIRFMAYQDLSETQRERIRDYYIVNIYPVLTPLAMDPGHPFPFISNLTINLLLTMRFPGETDLQTARVKIPLIKDLSSRLLTVENDDGDHLFVTLDDVIANNLDLLFPGMEIVSCEQFRVTRNINIVPLEDTTTDLVEMMQSELRERRFAPIVRLEVERGMNETHRGMLAAEMNLNADTDVFESGCMLGMRDLFEIAGLDIPDLHETPHQPVDHPLLAMDSRNIFHILRENGPLLLQHPYQSFNASVERFLRTASEDPKVLAIKMTLYRTSAKTEIIDLLVNAARNGKQVAVLVELRARFDEAANIDRGRMLEEAGVHVTYGVLGLKTHSKTILVVRQDFDKLRRYCHIATGNYNPDTASLYSDMGLLTCHEDIGHDLTQLFNYLTGYSPPPSYRKILVAPYAMKRPLIKKIEREATLHAGGTPGHIQLKTNALEDPDITRALYKAARVGVKIDLIVRDSCRLIPALPGLSENVTVISIVGRFLEHARIYHFRNGGDEEYYLGSADLMQRNLEDRVEVLVPVEDEELRQEIRLVLTAQLSDSRNAWDLKSDGTYVQRKPTSEKAARGSQEELIAVAAKRMDAASDLRKGQTSMSKEKKFRRKLLNRYEKRLQESNKSETSEGD